MYILSNAECLSSLPSLCCPQPAPVEVLFFLPATCMMLLALFGKLAIKGPAALEQLKPARRDPVGHLARWVQQLLRLVALAACSTLLAATHWRLPRWLSWLPSREVLAMALLLEGPMRAVGITGRAGCWLADPRLNACVNLALATGVMALVRRKSSQNFLTLQGCVGESCGQLPAVQACAHGIVNVGNAPCSAAGSRTVRTHICRCHPDCPPCERAFPGGQQPPAPRPCIWPRLVCRRLGMGRGTLCTQHRLRRA